MKICPICNTEYPPDEEFCSKDGQKLYTQHAKAHDPLLGMVFEGRYRVNRLIGEGGMGRVYQATNINAEMEVALKILNRAASQDPGVVKRFEVERRIISRLRHPNILKLLDSFRANTGELVIVVEYVAGETLEDSILKGLLDEKKTLYVLREVFDALIEAHSAGIIHRDLKPSNIMLEQIGDRTLVKILDFGIAKHLGSTGLTAGGTLGTPAYMSPEQIEGADLDGRSDLYSMGIVAYECLTGKPPFDGDNAFSIIRQHIMEVPPAFRSCMPPINVSSPVESLVQRLLAKSPQHRPIDARSAREEVEKLYATAASHRVNVTEQLLPDTALTGEDETLEGVHAETLLPEALAGFLQHLPTHEPGTFKPEISIESASVQEAENKADGQGEGADKARPASEIDSGNNDAVPAVGSVLVESREAKVDEAETGPFSITDFTSPNEDSDETSTNEVASIDFIPLIRDESVSAEIQEITESQSLDKTDEADIRFIADTGPLPRVGRSNTARNIAVVGALCTLGAATWFFFGRTPNAAKTDVADKIVVGKPAPNQNRVPEPTVKETATGSASAPQLKNTPLETSQKTVMAQPNSSSSVPRAAVLNTSKNTQAKPSKPPTMTAKTSPQTGTSKQPKTKRASPPVRKSARSAGAGQKMKVDRGAKKKKAKSQRETAKKSSSKNKIRAFKKQPVTIRKSANPNKAVKKSTKKVQAKYDDDLFD